MVFGRVADILGRKRIHGYEVLILGIGALASAFSPNLWWLIVFRIILGLLLGSVGNQVAAHAQRTVMIVRAPTATGAG